jgi:hypothetical protein
MNEETHIILVKQRGTRSGSGPVLEGIVQFKINDDGAFIKHDYDISRWGRWDGEISENIEELTLLTEEEYFIYKL